MDPIGFKNSKKKKKKKSCHMFLDKKVCVCQFSIEGLPWRCCLFCLPCKHRPSVPTTWIHAEQTEYFLILVSSTKALKHPF